MGVQIWVHTVTPTHSHTTLIVLPMPHTIHAQVAEQTKRGTKTLDHLVRVPPAGFKLEGVDARSSRLQKS